MGGTGGGGSSSGKIEYPAYLSSAHKDLINVIARDQNDALGKNPYLGASSYDPAPSAKALAAAIDAYPDLNLVAKPKMERWWTAEQDIFLPMLEHTKDFIDFKALAAKQRGDAEDEFYNEVLPKFRAGMRDAGVVQASSFKIGEALLWSKFQKDGAYLAAELENKYILAMLAEEPRMLSDIVGKETAEEFQVLEHKRDQMRNKLHYTLETIRMSYTMFKEFTDTNMEYKVLGVTWALEMDKYMMDALACVSGAGGQSVGAGRSVSKAQSAVGGALSGAATGAMIGSGIPGVGTAIGAGVGGVAGLIGGLLS